MKLSVIIPSLRAEKIEALAKKFAEYVKDYELIVISPNEITVENVVWIKEEERLGIYKAVERGVKVMKGDFVLHMPDDIEIFPETVDTALKFVDGKKKFIGGFRCVGIGNQVFEIGGYYGTIFASCPIFSRDTLKGLDNTLMDTYYSSFYGDPDLSLRLWTRGGTVSICEDAKMLLKGCHDEHKISSLEMYEKEDNKKFIERWSPILGEYNGYEQY